MSAAAVIDSLEFAGAQDELRGSLLVASLKRLEDLLFDPKGSVHYEVRGLLDERNRPRLALKIGGSLHLQCQRCLGLLDYEVDVLNALLLVTPGAHVDEDLDDPDAPDVIEGSRELDVAGLIEDEVLLSLPLAPRHAEGDCESRLARGTDARPKPFAELAALKGRGSTR